MFRTEKMGDIKRQHNEIIIFRANLNNARVCPFISKSSSFFNNPLVTIPTAPITIGIIVTFMLHSFF